MGPGGGPASWPPLSCPSASRLARFRLTSCAVPLRDTVTVALPEEDRVCSTSIARAGSSRLVPFTARNRSPAGDLILAVNDPSLDDPARAMEVLQTLSSSGSATVTVSRNGTAQEVNLNLANLDADGQDNGGRRYLARPHR